MRLRDRARNMRRVNEPPILTRVSKACADWKKKDEAGKRRERGGRLKMTTKNDGTESDQRCKRCNSSARRGYLSRVKMRCDMMCCAGDRPACTE